MNHRSLVLLIGLSLGWAGSTSLGGQAEKAASAPPAATVVEQRTPAPDFALRDAKRQKVRLSDFKGKVVLLNFWATWCGPCKLEMPWFVEFHRKYKDRGFSVVGVSLDEEGWKVVRPFAKELQLNFPVLLGNDEMADQFGGVDGLPTTFLIDKQGRIAAKHQGLVSKSDYQEEIERLL